jgi:hypothetical protein
VVEEGGLGDAAVVDMNHAGRGVVRELLRVAVPGGPGGGIDIQQYQGALGLDRRRIGSGAEGVERVCADQPCVEVLDGQVVALHPADREVDGAVGYSAGLSVGGRAPRVNVQLCDARSPGG